MRCSTQIAKEHGGIMRFIQVSCLGASPSSESRMLRTKAAGEQSILKEFPEVIILSFSALVMHQAMIIIFSGPSKGQSQH